MSMGLGRLWGAVLDASNVNSERGDVLYFWFSVGFACTGWRIHSEIGPLGGIQQWGRGPGIGRARASMAVA